ncbi:MAG: AMP-binding protein [Aquabacterium sp.]
MNLVLPHPIPLPGLTVADAFAAAAARCGDRPAVQVLAETAAIYGIGAGETSYAQLAARIARLRAAYAASGYGHGHRVGLLLENRPAFIEHWFALNALGVSIVPIGADLRAAELEYLVGHSGVAAAGALPQRHAALRDAAAAAGRPLVISSDADIETQGLSSPDTAAPDAGRAPDEATECALLYTSGTTGRPKGCRLSNRYVRRAGHWYLDLGGHVRLKPGAERMLTPLPLNHVNALAFSVTAMTFSGGCIVLLDRFHPASWWDSVRASRATGLHYLGVMPAMLMKAEPSARDREHGVRFGFGAGVDRLLQAPFEARFGFPLLEGWSMTETGAGAVVFAGDEPRAVGSNCFGREAPGLLVRLLADDGSEVTTDAPGELLVRAAGSDPRDGFFSGYLKDEAATAEAWAGDWFHTGDIVRRDAQGLLHFIDRRKNVIRRSGENISAVEVESVLNRHPAVKQVAVAATPDAIRGDEVLACVVTHAPLGSAEQAALAQALQQLALEQLAYYKAPGYVVFLDALPLTPSQKIARGELKALAAQLPAQGGCLDLRAGKKRQVDSP